MLKFTLLANCFPDLFPEFDIWYCWYWQKTADKPKLKLSRILLFEMKTTVCLKYFLNDCISKQFFASNLPYVPSNLNSYTIFVQLISQDSNLNIKQLSCQKVLQITPHLLTAFPIFSLGWIFGNERLSSLF